MKRAIYRLITTMAVAAGLAAGFTSCEKEVVEDTTIPESELIERKDIELTRAQMDFVRSNNGFAIELFKKVSETGKSAVISPLSVTFALGMVNNGAVGDTQKEISEALGYKEGSADGLNGFCETMLRQMTEVDPSTKLELANMALVNKGLVPLKNEFSSTIQSIYDAEVCYKDFNKEDIKGYVNRWCEQKTHGMIKDFLNSPVSPRIYSLFLNATYFKGIWSNKFKKSDSKKEKFTMENGNKVTVNMMRQKDKFDYGGYLGLYRTLTLPYGNQAFRMTFVLPEEGKTLDDIKSLLDQESWSEMISKQAGVVTDVKIPSFETELETSSLKEALEALGIKKAFDYEQADFSKMTDLDVYISDVIHKAKIKVDEEGSEAAAVTAVIAVAGSNGSSDYKPMELEFHADRPFLYAITEVSTGAILFIGQYTGQ